MSLPPPLKPASASPEGLGSPGGVKTDVSEKPLSPGWNSAMVPLPLLATTRLSMPFAAIGAVKPAVGSTPPLDIVSEEADADPRPEINVKLVEPAFKVTTPRFDGL